VLDVRMPGLSGLDLQGEFAKSGDPIPIIFITGHGDIPMAVRAIKAGAVEFLAKPFRDDDLLEAIRTRSNGTGPAAAKPPSWRNPTQIRHPHRARAEVIALMVKGMLNKQAAAELGVAEMTVKVHRHNIMQKMKVRSLPDLVRMMEKVNAR
jgi:FixJ family two-component response regulator